LKDESAKPGYGGQIKYRPPSGDSGGYVNDLIAEAFKAYNDGKGLEVQGKRAEAEEKYYEAKNTVEKAMMWFGRLENAKTDEERAVILSATTAAIPTPRAFIFRKRQGF